MKKAKPEKMCAADHIKKLRRSIKTMRIGRTNEMQTVMEAFEVKFFDKGQGCKIERKKGFFKNFF